MDLQQFKKEAKLTRKSSRYSVYDLSLDHLMVSLTVLHPYKETRGHSHKVEEIYFFQEGKGIIKINGKQKKVRKGEIITIEKMAFHKVFNSNKKDLVFFSIFRKYKGRGKKK